jgi:acyl-CoA synthetase (AMP-forming)/AMP-acid ligase II
MINSIANQMDHAYTVHTCTCTYTVYPHPILHIFGYIAATLYMSYLQTHWSRDHGLLNSL